MSPSLATPLLLAACLSATPALAQEPPLTFEAAKLISPTVLAEAYFGSSLDLDGDVLVVGAPGYDPPTQDCGEAQIYRRTAGSWVLEARRSAHVPDQAFFGWSVAVSGNRVIVGAPKEDPSSSDRGAAYIYEHDGVAWQPAARLLSIGAPHAQLGSSVAIDGDLAAATAAFEQFVGQTIGAVYLWRRTATGWTPEALLFPSQETQYAQFGNRIAIHGDRVAVQSSQASGVGPGTGAVYVYERAGGVWSETARLVGWAASGVQLGHLTGGLALDANTLVVGSPRSVAGAGLSGLAFVYEFQGGAWTPAAQLQQPTPHHNDYFGSAVRLDASRLLIGAYGATIAGVDDLGAAYLFEHVNGAWVQRRQFVASDASAQASLGFAAGFSGDVAVVGAYYDSSAATHAGSAYEFDASPTALPGTPICLGDGSAAPCPCGNASPAGEPRGCVNSTGEGGWLEATGSTSLTANELGLWARSLPAQAPVLLFAGTVAAAGGAGLPFGDGLRCADGAVVRLGSTPASLFGVAAWTPRQGLSALGGAGGSVRLQAWYRDALGPCGTNFNLTNGVELVLTP